MNIDKLVGIFYFNKLAALVLSIGKLIDWLSTCYKHDDIHLSRLFSRHGLLYLILFLLCLSSWHFNKRAASTCALRSDHALSYASEGAIQNFIMFLCYGMLAIYRLFHNATDGWTIAICIALLLILIWSGFRAYKILDFVGLMKIFNIAPPEAFEYEGTMANYSSGLIRYIAVIYTIYFIFYYW